MKQGTLRPGFSLIEIMIAVTIMAILAFTIVPAFMRYLNKAKVSSAQTTLRQLKNAITEFYAEKSQYPPRLRDLVKKPQEEELAKNWEPFLEVKNQQIPLDPWKNQYQYKVTPENKDHPYDLFSYGSKGKSGSKKDRISVWDL